MSKINELKKVLVANGVAEAEVATMSKKQLEEAVEGLESAKVMIDTADTSVNENDAQLTEEEQKEEKTYNPVDPEWTDWILSQMEDYEKVDENPKCDGLRRIAEKILGPFDSETQVIQTPDVNNGYRATVVVHLHFPYTRYKFRCSGAADVSNTNTDKKFASHAVATAESRAEGRALRKALRLTKVITAEEASTNMEDKTDISPDLIPESMISGLMFICAKKDIDLLKLAQHMGYNVTEARELRHKDGIAISNKLSQYIRGELEIPSEILS